MKNVDVSGAYGRIAATLALGGLLAGLACAGGCSSDDGTSLNERPAGTKDGPCLPSGGCDRDLTCKNGKCVSGTGSGGSNGSGGSTGTGGGSSGASGSTGTGGTSGQGSGGSAGSGTTDGGGAGGSSGQDGAGGSSGQGGAGGQCTGTHPLLDGGARFCAPGQCRCEATDACFPRTQAARCCNGALRCFEVDGGVECNARHPVVDGGSRFCGAGDCYCKANDACYSATVAKVCCNEAPVCS